MKLGVNHDPIRSVTGDKQSGEGNLAGELRDRLKVSPGPARELGIKLVQ